MSRPNSYGSSRPCADTNPAGLPGDRAAVAIAEPAYRLHRRRRTIVPAELAPQAEHRELDPVLADAARVVPHLLEQLARAHHRPGVPDQRVEKPELDRRQPHLTAADQHTPLAGIEVYDAVVVHPLGPRRLPAAAQQRLDPGDQLSVG